jgi:DNA-binding HxlR family transcriptional regulator
MKPSYGCPVTAAVKVLAGKWKVAILWHLDAGTKRFAELRGLLPGVSEKVLTEQLRQLEADGLVQRQAANSSPPRVSYQLTSPGKELMPWMLGLCDWGTRHLGIHPTFRVDEPRDVKA